MSQFVEGNMKTFTSGATIPAFSRVILTSGELAVAGLTDGPSTVLGTTEVDCVDGDYVAVRLSTATGTRKVIAAAAISQGANVYTAADGEVSTTANTAYMVGIALEAATADQDIIEILDIVDTVAISGL